MNGLWSWLYQLVLLLVAVFLFMVLFQYGTADFPRHASEEFDSIRGQTHGAGADSAAPN
ncbi:MAG: hypothetical protein ACREKL_13640 [Chthoniobacterales bacterium]